MSHSHYNLFNRRKTPQTRQIPGSTQVLNDAGGYSWAIDPWERLMCLLILETEGGTYYVSEQNLTRENALNALECLEMDYFRFISIVVEVSEKGRTYKNDPALFCPVLAAASPDANARDFALWSLPMVARTGTHFFHFIEYFNGMRGWGAAYAMRSDAYNT